MPARVRPRIATGAGAAFENAERSARASSSAVDIGETSLAAQVNGPTLSGRQRTLRAVDTDIPLKELFRMRARDLLPLTNDAGSDVVLVANPVNVQAARRAVDFVICLRRGSEEYVLPDNWPG